MWSFAAQARLWMLISANVLDRPINLVAAEYGTKMFEYMRGVAPNNEEGARLMNMYINLCNKETVRWVITAGFRTPGGPFYMQPPTWENLITAWNLLGYCTSEIAFGNWPVVCTQIIRQDDIVIATALCKFLLPDITADELVDCPSGLPLYLLHGADITAPTIPVPPTYKAPTLNIAATSDSITAPRQVPIGRNIGMVQASHLHRADGATDQTMIRSFFTSAQDTIVDYSYINTGETIEKLVSKLSRAMKGGQSLPVAIIKRFISKLCEISASMVDCRLSSSDFNRLRAAWARPGRENPPSISAWIAEKIDGFGTMINAPLAIVDDKGIVSISYTILRNHDSNAVLDAIWSVMHKGMRCPKKMIIARDSGFNSFSSMHFDPVKFEEATANKPWTVSRTTNISLGGAIGLGAQTSSYKELKEKCMQEGIDAAELTRQGTIGVINNIIKTTSSGLFHEALAPPTIVANSHGKPMSLDDTAARAAWNIGGCPSWTSGSGAVKHCPLTPRQLEKSYHLFMKSVEKETDAPMHEIQVSFPADMIAEHIAGRAHRGTLETADNRAMARTIVPWFLGNSRQTAVAPPNSINSGASSSTLQLPLRLRNRGTAALPPSAAPPLLTAPPATVPSTSSARASPARAVSRRKKPATKKRGRNGPATPPNPFDDLL